MYLTVDPAISRPVLELPCGKLTHLTRLCMCNKSLQLHTGSACISTRSSTSRALSLSQHSAAAAAVSHAGHTAPLLPQLQKLQLECCSVPPLHFLQLSKLTGLSSLQIAALHLPGADGASDINCYALRAVLQKLTQLSELLLLEVGLTGSTADVSAPVQALASISNMRHLKHLALDGEDSQHVNGVMPVLPTSLTALQLWDVSLNAEAVEGVAFLSRLASLQLKLTRVALCPQVLSSCTTQLRKLALKDTRVFTAAGFAPAVLAAHVVKVTELLGAIGRLTQLETLDLSGVDLSGVPCRRQNIEGEALEQFSKLTMSSQLTALRLHAGMEDLPRGMLQHMLPAGKQLPQLRVLCLEERTSCAPFTVTDSVSGADIARIGKCCSGLTELSLLHVPNPSGNLSGLLALQSTLRFLHVRGAAFGDAAVAVVAQLTGLQCLIWEDNYRLTDESFRQLTALKSLTTLTVWECPGLGVMKGLDPLVGAEALDALPHAAYLRKGIKQLKASAQGQQPDVWSQLASLYKGWAE